MKKNSWFIIIIALLLFCFWSAPLAAQAPQKDLTRITGKVIEAATKQAVPYATVSVIETATQNLLTGTATNDEGSFTLATKAKPADFYVEISFIGFDTKIIDNFTADRGFINLGTITINESSESLEAVTIEGEKSNLVFKLDKRVFNVGQDLSSAGASALEVLDNVPSVNVSIEGQVSLRGSTGVQMLINGKPSVIASEEGNALGSITADMIDRVEVITNPSAKYNAEGTSGIINIVLKKEDRKGINGSISVNTGVPDNHSVGLSINQRTEKFNLFSQLGAGYRSWPRDSENINTNYQSQSSIFSDGTAYRDETFFNITLGADYYINPLNTITLSGNFAYEIEDQPSSFTFTNSIANDVIASWQRREVTEATNPKYQYELQYKRDFKDDEDHALLISALGNFFGKDQSSEFLNESILGSLENELQQTATDFGESKYTFNIDYTHPIKDKFTVETGAQYVLQDVENDYSVTNFVDNNWVIDPNLTNEFNYEQNVLGLYATTAYEQDPYGLKMGLRLENTDLTTLLSNTNERNSQNYTNLFPSVHASYKLTDRLSFQAGYSKRIYRPHLWSLNPFYNIRNNYSVYTGNPDLQPEFTDSYELNSIYILQKVSLNLGIYYRYTTDVIERVGFFEDNVTTYMPLNIGTNRATGLELNAKIMPARWLSINSDLNYNVFKREGVFESSNFDFTADNWSAKLMAKFKLPANIDVELTGHYRSEEEQVQSVRDDMIFANLGLRKKLLNKRAVLSASIRDIFESRNRNMEIENANFYAYNKSYSGRFATLGFSYSFGKGEAMEYSGRHRHF